MTITIRRVASIEAMKNELEDHRRPGFWRALGESMDGRPDGWQSSGAKAGTDEQLLLAEVDGDVVGLLWGHRQPDEIALPDRPRSPYGTIDELEALTAGSWFISSFAVEFMKRRQGVGSRLLNAAEEAAGNGGARQMSVIVPLPDAPDPGPRPTMIGYETHYPRRLDTVPFLEKRGYSNRDLRFGLFSLGIPVTNQLMIKDLADG